MMQHFILPFLASLGLASAFADPLSCSGTCVNTHDPSLFRRGSDGTYYRFATGGGMPIFSAPSLTGAWTYLGEVLPSGSSIANSGANDAWAPDVQYKDGQYYLYYSVSSFGTQNSAIGVATSPNMDPGTWTDHGSTGIESSSGDPYNAIDGNLFITSSGTNLLTFGSFYGDIYQAPLSGDALTWGGGDVYNIEYNATGTRPSEGPFLFEYGDYFYLFWSSGSCCGYDSDRPAPGDEYKVMVCRSNSATGNFVDASGRACTDGGGTLVLGSHGNVYGPGGQSVFNDPSEGPVLVYHYVDTTIGFADGDKRLGINKIDFSSGWPIV
ncbi:glycoside hydrolase family 43 protein [Hortaea werneckii]|uniref:Arabinan endo-1,5-alpha-L-arabinosidase n=1 Tax=Hortaea werneckii TaxID=91943 RepID=A0A3M7IUL6_HORWE|nr:glycoside hydrolase family 43 protein [Hortaea werneckii]KAI6843360.1 glycoside hydrolase family 43 protein [Hortaea werneckii]KAI6933819.1 glycoside hydrolase family 43 protein [Hortaea werneckii]KAI6937456.1 glycoside hydrolase family 43 protein [Hortaea werneckii]KAI6965086.1 glycoside hydrolase family 43 protein [Hortaea werneckii]